MDSLNAIRLVSINSIHRTQSSSSSSSSLSFKGRISSSLITQKVIRVSANSLSALTYSRNIVNMGAAFAARCTNAQLAGDAGPPGKPPKSWREWVVGALLSIVLPFAHIRWGRLLAIKNEVETVVKTVETVVEVVEKVAEGVAEVADEVADHLPDGGKLKSVVCIVENVAKETAKDAHIADQFIEKVEEVEKEVESAFLEIAEKTDIKLEATQDDEDGASKDKNQEEEIVSVSAEQLPQLAVEVSQDQVIKDANQIN